MTATASLTGLFAALNQCREPDFALLGIIADALEEAGDERAEGYRWAVEVRRWPYTWSTNPAQYLWVSQVSVLFSYCDLPDSIYNWRHFGLYNAQSAAFDDLSSMIRKRNAAQPQEG